MPPVTVLPGVIASVSPLRGVAGDLGSVCTTSSLGSNTPGPVPGAYNPLGLALTPGTCVGPYEIVGLLGVGGMGEVYRARDTTLGRDVAIKVLPDAFAHDAERMARFEREA